MIARSVVLMMLCLAISLEVVYAGTVTFAWDRPVMRDGTAIPCEAHLLYRVSWGSIPRGASQTFSYPNRTLRTPLRRITVSVPSGKVRYFSVHAYVGQDHTWEVDGKGYALKAGDGLFSEEITVTVP